MEAKRNTLIGRDSELDKLNQHILKFGAANAANPELRIVGISGSGGVGKTFLLDAALDESRGALDQALTIKIDASNEHLLREFTLIIDQMLAPTEIQPPAKAKYDYFPASRELIRRQLQLIGMVETDILKNKAHGEQVKEVAKLLYRLSPAIKYIPKCGPAIANTLKEMEVAKVEELVKPALDALSSVKSLKDKRGFFANPLNKRRFTALRHSPYEAIAEAYISDVTSMLVGYPKKDRFRRLTHSSIPGLNRFLLIVDDFEVVGHVIGNFMVESLLPRLKNARFSALVIILGRDSLHEANRGFSHHLAGNITDPIHLKPFTESEGVKYLLNFGYTDMEAREWYQKSRGLPFILRLLAENRSDEEKQSALFFKRFYERTTRWMSETERKWLTPICYLDKVDEGAIKILLPREDSGLVMTWFENEASVRDVKSADFCVTPYLRHMLLEYNRRKVGDASHKRLQEEARRAMQGA